LGFKTLIHQEGAETEKQRSAPRDFSLAMQMRYFVQAFERLLHSEVNGYFHVIFSNRGVVDILTWLEFLHRTEKITLEELEHCKTFILKGPWMSILDVVVCLKVDVETALEREYGEDYRTRDTIFGSMMNPKSLAIMKECVDGVCEDIRREAPNLPLLVVDTAKQTEEETEAEITEFILTTLEHRLKITEDQVLPWCIDIMREKAWVSGPEVKLLGSVTHEKLRKLGWQLEAGVVEVDDYLSPKGEAFLQNDACFHLRQSGEMRYFVFKRDIPLAWHRPKIPIPISANTADELLKTFDQIVRVKKEREIFTRNGFVLHLDRVEELGEFIEIKGLMATTDEELMQVVGELGFREGDIVYSTYLRLMLAKYTAS